MINTDNYQPEVSGEKYLVSTFKEHVYDDPDYNGPLVPYKTEKVIGAIGVLNATTLLKLPNEDDIEEFTDFWMPAFSEDDALYTRIEESWPVYGPRLFRIFQSYYDKKNERILMAEYENLTKDQKSQIRKVADFLLNLPYGCSVTSSFGDDSSEYFDIPKTLTAEERETTKTTIIAHFTHFILSEGGSVIRYKEDPNGADIVSGLLCVGGQIKALPGDVTKKCMPKGNGKTTARETYRTPTIFF